MKATIHLLHEDPNGKILSNGMPGSNQGVKSYSIACAPEASGATHMTGEAAATTCPKCKATEVYKELEQRDSAEDGDGLRYDECDAC